MLKRIIATTFFICLLLAAVPALAAQQSPSDRVREAVDEIIVILSNPEMTDPAKRGQAISVLRKTAQKYISFRLATMYSVGKPWLEMSAETQDELVSAFTDLLECTYLQRIPSYGGENVEYENEIIAGNRAKVFTKIVGKEKTISVEFRLRNMDGKWMIYDTVAEGVSLVNNYRSQFSELLSSGTPDELVDKLRARACELVEQQNAEQKAEQNNEQENAQ